jgi:hypothetical protein
MRRTWVLVLIVGAALLAAGVAAWWWTAAPAASVGELAAALAVAPAADGRVAIAQPRRAARWLLRHPQALALAALAAPQARSALPRLQPLLRPLAEGADGPLVLWWRGADLAVAVRLRPGAANALAMVAARAGVAFHFADGIAAVATDAALLGTGTPPAAARAAGRAAVLAEIAGREWRVVALPTSLAAWTGTTPELPAAAGASRAATVDAGRLPAAWGVPAGAAALPARAAFAAGQGWGAAVPLTVVPRFVRDANQRANRDSDGTSNAPKLWKGLLGEVWVAGDGERLVVATNAAMLAEVEPAPTRDEGSVSGADVAWVAAALAATLEQVPLFSRETRALRAAGAFTAGLDRARWCSTAAGTRIELTW